MTTRWQRLKSPVVREVVRAAIYSMLARLLLLFAVVMPLMIWTGGADSFVARSIVYTVLDGLSTVVFGVLIALMAIRVAHQNIEAELRDILNQRRKNDELD